MSWLGEGDGRPFFAYVASAAPHRPCVPPSFVQGTSAAGARGDSIHLVDWMVGELVDALAAAGELDNTLFLVTSDNGTPMIFPEDGDVANFPPNGPWRGQKADAYEGGHRVPLVCAGPGVPAQASRGEVISLLDLLPTIAEVVGATGVAGDGVAFPLAPEVVEADPERIIGVQAYDGRLVLRSGDRKAIYGSGSGGFSEPVGEPCGPHDPDGQVYDLGNDPAETRNLWGDGERPEVVLHERFSNTTGYAWPTR
ncbi:sulfatase-like hydrolase/transferase [Tessaracoccus rhinocerotis]|uniref:sulfatase-like hydrolase/transferase n=1 Tax=Tessaracoccus rhinocerotis TaxID=1689449 RepID=UPI001FE873FB|nr:sulfatase-like hydrolase/transferase [Tessaracoccus rhinocerotis]